MWTESTASQLLQGGAVEDRAEFEVCHSKACGGGGGGGIGLEAISELSKVGNDGGGGGKLIEEQ